ncbi:MAG: SMI1/KNR4 family protein [Polyangiaceae bacterium]|nr:SMI1/KNR4 family protein [Polyangiaceae bacterium]
MTLSIKERLDQMVATLRGFPLARIIVGPETRKGLDTKELDQLEGTHGVILGSALREFYGVTNGFTLFWRVARDASPDLMERYDAASPNPTTCINWEMIHGFLIPPLEVVLKEKPFGDITITHRDEETMRLWAGRPMTDEMAAASIRVFDRYLAEGNEDGCIGLLMFPDTEPRIVGITDSAMVDPKRPWMKVETYLDLTIAMGGEYGSRYGHTGMASVPSGELAFTPEQIAQFGRDILRPLG